MRRLIPLGLVAALLAVWAWRHFDSRGATNVLRLSGNIELTEVTLAFKTPGRLLELLVNEGDDVRAGQPLARLDRAELEQGLAREQAGVDAAASLLAQVRTSVEWQRQALAAELDLRRAEVKAAEIRLEEMLAGSRAEEREQARAAEAEARAQHTAAAADWDRAQRLFANDDISAQQHDQARTRFEATAAALERARQTRGLVEAGPRVEQVEQQRAAVERARAALALTEAGRLELRRREQELDARAAAVRQASAQASVLSAQLEDRLLASPIDGMVLAKTAEPGEVLAAGAAVLTLGDIDRPWVRAYISQRDLGRVRTGMPVEVYSDSYPGKRYAGRITYIHAEAEFTPKQIQTEDERVKLVYRIKVEVENPGRELKSNMPVDAVIGLP